MSDKKTKRDQLLVNFALKIDQEGLFDNDSNDLSERFQKLGSPNTGSLSDAHADLNSDEKRELERVRKALAFIRSAGESQSVPKDSLADTETPLVPGDMTIVEVQREPVQSVGQTSQDLGQDGLGTVGRFQLDCLVGTGGFAKVYRAHDPILDRPVAVKLLESSPFFSGSAQARFEREAVAAAALSHPNIVPVFETGTIAEQRFIVSAFCDGVTLEQWLESEGGVAEQRTAALLIATLAEAVAHAHQRRIIHRDLKPANILIEKHGGDDGETDDKGRALADSLRITDFGLAKNLGTEDPLQTVEGAIVGTPIYMSPEQAVGKSAVSGKADVYSLGVMLYQLLTGEVPFRGETHLDTLLMIREKEVKPPRKINSAIHRDLEAICMKCLSKLPAGRYDAYGLAHDLNRWLNGEVVVARRVTRAERIRKWCVRNPLLATAFAAMSVALVTALIQWRIAVFESKRADQSHAMTQELIDELVTEVAGNSKLQPEMRKGFVQRAVDLQVRLLNVAPDDRQVILNTARSYRQLAVLLTDFGEAELGLEAIEEALVLVEPYLDEPGFAKSKTNSVQTKAGILRVLKEDELAEEAIHAGEKSTPQSVFDQAKNYFQLGVTKSISGKFPESIVDFELALSMFDLLQATDAERYPDLEAYIAKTHFHFACSEMGLELLGESKFRFRTALTWFESNLEQLPPNHNREPAIINIARCYLQLARLAQAQLKLDTFDADQKVRLLAESRDCFDRAEVGFQSLVELNPMLNGGWGQLAMVLELRIRLETEQADCEAASGFAETFGELFARTPERVREYQIIGRILVESRIRVAKLMVVEGQIANAIRQLDLTKSLLEELVEKFPGNERLESLWESYDDLLAEISG